MGLIIVKKLMPSFYAGKNMLIDFSQKIKYLKVFGSFCFLLKCGIISWKNNNKTNTNIKTNKDDDLLVYI